MSWNDRQYLTEIEALDKRELPFSKFAAGDRIEMSLAELDEEFDSAPVLKGVIVGISFTASQVRYDIAFPIKDSDIMIVVKDVRAQMFRPSDGAETNFIPMEQAVEMVKSISVKPELTVVTNEQPAGFDIIKRFQDNDISAIIKELEDKLVQCNRYNYCADTLSKLKEKLGLTDEN